MSNMIHSNVCMCILYKKKNVSIGFFSCFFNGVSNPLSRTIGGTIHLTKFMITQFSTFVHSEILKDLFVILCVTFKHENLTNALNMVHP